MPVLELLQDSVLEAYRRAPSKASIYRNVQIANARQPWMALIQVYFKNMAKQHGPAKSLDINGSFKHIKTSSQNCTRHKAYL